MLLGIAAAASSAARSSGGALVPTTLDVHADSILPYHPSAVWTMASMPIDVATDNSTAGSLRRSAMRLHVAQPPEASELCELGLAMPHDLTTIVITGGRRRARAERSLQTMCLPNPVYVEGYAPFHNESEVTLADRATFGPGAFEALSLGEIAIHLSHLRALERCAAVQQARRGFGCLIMEDDFTLIGPRLAARWNASLAALQQQPDWHLLFVGRCLDARCGRNDLRVSAHADLYRTPRREAAVGEYGWQYITPMCLHAYMVTLEGAARMIDGLTSCAGLCPADWAPAVISNSSSIFTIAPPIFTQSSALRLMRDSGAVVTDADAARGIETQLGNSHRPAIIAECMLRDVAGNSLPASVAAPWFRSFGGSNGAKLNEAIQRAHDGMQAADANGVEAPTLSACAGLRARLTVGASRSFLVDGAWMPGPEAVDASLQGCALQYTASGADAQCDHAPLDMALRCPFATGAADRTAAARISKLHCLADRAGFVSNDSSYTVAFDGGWHALPATNKVRPRPRLHTRTLHTHTLQYATCSLCTRSFLPACSRVNMRVCIPLVAGLVVGSLADCGRGSLSGVGRMAARGSVRLPPRAAHGLSRAPRGPRKPPGEARESPARPGVPAGAQGGLDGVEQLDAVLAAGRVDERAPEHADGAQPHRRRRRARADQSLRRRLD